MKNDIQLSEHFKLSEFTRSATATARKIDNTPSQEVISNLKALCQNVLEPLRAFAGQPIIIGSGYRSPALNKAVGGVKNSQHMTGEACDIRLPRTPYVDWGDNLAHTDMSVAYRWLDFLEHHTDFDHYQNLNLIKSRVCGKYSTDCVSREVLIIMFDNNICSHEQRPA